MGVLCPPNSSTPYRDQPPAEHIGGYPTPAQVTALGVDAAQLDAEGRCVVLEFPAFVIFGVYSPANSNGLRDDFRYGFLTALDIRIRNLEALGKRVILTGDLNVSREEIDTAKAEEHIRQEGITRDDYLNAPNRRVFNQLVEHGRVPGQRDPGRERSVLWDLCREMHPDREGMFTHWEQKINARPGNFGSRIDYVLCSIDMKSWFADANIQEGLMGSDHCPVYATIKDIVQDQGKEVHITDVMNPPGTFVAGVRTKEHNLGQHTLSLSGRLLPEFDKRRSIKDMFSKAKTLVKTPAVLPPTEVQLSEHAKPTLASDTQPVTTSRTSSKPSLKSPEKRRASSVVSPRNAKKSKNSAPVSSKTSSLASSKGQQSLKGFFTPKDSVLGEAERASTPDTAKLTTKPSGCSSMPWPDTTESFKDPEASKESWVKLFSRRPPPRCESHSEPCISLTTKKAGINCGRQFWICSR